MYFLSSLGCLQGIVEYVNKYAFTQVAIYGKAFVPAARDTWTILKDRGIVQLINDNLIGNVWTMGAIMAGVKLCSPTATIICSSQGWTRK